MGKNLALKTKPGTLLVYDVNKAAVERFVDTFPQAKAVSDPGEMAEKAGLVLTMLPEANHVEQAHKALWDGLDESSLLVDSSTIAAEEARRLSQKVMDAKKGTAFDAPVSGGKLVVNDLR